jgi:hypothetical protein
MADLTYKDWGRIYAYMWLQDRAGNPYYKNLSERDPVRAIAEIVEALNKEYPDPNLKIEYTPEVDAVWNIEPPPELSKEKLKMYATGGDAETIATVEMRLTC